MGKECYPCCPAWLDIDGSAFSAVLSVNSMTKAVAFSSVILCAGLPKTGQTLDEVCNR